MIKMRIEKYQKYVAHWGKLFYPWYYRHVITFGIDRCTNLICKIAEEI